MTAGLVGSEEVANSEHYAKIDVRNEITINILSYDSTADLILLLSLIRV